MTWFVNGLELVLGIGFGIFIILFLMAVIVQFGEERELKKLGTKVYSDDHSIYINQDVCVKNLKGCTFIKIKDNAIVVDSNGNISINNKPINIEEEK